MWDLNPAKVPSPLLRKNVEFLKIGPLIIFYKSRLKWFNGTLDIFEGGRNDGTRLCVHWESQRFSQQVAEWSCRLTLFREPPICCRARFWTLRQLRSPILKISTLRETELLRLSDVEMPGGSCRCALKSPEPFDRASWYRPMTQCESSPSGTQHGFCLACRCWSSLGVSLILPRIKRIFLN